MKYLELFVMASFIFPGAIFADQYHYKDVLIGDRAAGLSGAYSAISDDPSGMYYNPAGIVYSTENYLSLSVNAFSASSETFKNIVAGQDYSYNSTSLTPSFFGFLQSIGKGKFGFFVAIPSSDSIDQNDSLTAITNIPDQGNIFQRRFFHKDITYLFGPSYGQEISPQLSVGISLPLAIRNDNLIDNQFAVYNPATGTTLQRWFFQESSRSTNTYALQPKVGLQYMPWPKWAMGLTFSMPFKIAGSGKYSSRNLITSTTTVPNGYVTHDINSDSGSLDPRVPHVYQASFGITNFVSKKFLLSGNFDYYGPDAGYNNAAVAAVPYNIKATWNGALGGELYIADSLAFRLGFYTNRANTAVVDANYTNQPEHVNQYGGTMGFSYYRSGTSLSLTGGYAYGKGEGQGVSATNARQTVIRNSTNILLSGTYQM